MKKFLSRLIYFLLGIKLLTTGMCTFAFTYVVLG